MEILAFKSRRARGRRVPVAIWVLGLLCLTETACTREKAAAGAPGSAVVAGSGKDRYFVRDASGKSVTNADTNTAVDLAPGSYIVELNGTAQPLIVREGQRATATAGTAVVAGTGKNRYFARDVSGRSLTNADTNHPIELFPGNYIVELNGTTQPITVREGQLATVTAGSAMVAGTGKGRYFARDVSGKSLTNADTNNPIELFPGNYIVELNGTTQPVTVREGQMATVAAGSAMVAGTGKGRYFAQDASGKSLTNADTNHPIELFPGNYIVELNGTTQPITVREGELATVTAGSAMVAGTGDDRYFVGDASGKSLTNAATNTAVELFPGSYTIDLKGTKQSLAVRPGQQTVLQAK
jgi:hypothetical protein